MTRFHLHNLRGHETILRGRSKPRLNSLSTRRGTRFFRHLEFGRFAPDRSPGSRTTVRSRPRYRLGSQGRFGQGYWHRRLGYCRHQSDWRVESASEFLGRRCENKARNERFHPPKKAMSVTVALPPEPLARRTWPGWPRPLIAVNGGDDIGFIASVNSAFAMCWRDRIYKPSVSTRCLASSR